MKKLASILAVTLAAGVLATGCGSSSGSASKDSSSDSGKTVIKAATGANAKPYVYVGDDDKPAGYDVDVLNAVFDKLPDYELEYEVTDWICTFLTEQWKLSDRSQQLLLQRRPWSKLSLLLSI